jgi:peptidyl-prolyl cis-trans isomerase C
VTPRIPTRRAVRRWFTVLPTQPRSRWARVAAAALLVVIGLASGADLAAQQLGRLPDDVALRAAGQSVTRDQLQQRITVMEYLYGVHQPPDPAGAAAFRRSAAKAVAVSAVVEQAARGRGITVSDKTAGDQLDKLIQENGEQNRHAFLQELGARGISQREVVDEIKRQQQSAQLFGQVTAGSPTASDAAARAYYDANRAQMASPEQREVFNIVLPSQDRAQDAVRQARAGGDFAALARQLSIDGSTKDNGGSLGQVAANQLDPGYARVAFQAPAGAIFGPVRTPQGWNVGRIGKVVGPTPLAFEQLTGPIKAKLNNDAKLRAWNAFLGERIREAGTEYAPDLRPPDPDAPTPPK